jgi:hypothetical protein
MRENYKSPLDFIKLANLMKDELDLLVKKKYNDGDLTVYGILVEADQVFLYAMDLIYDT